MPGELTEEETYRLFKTGEQLGGPSFGVQAHRRSLGYARDDKGKGNG
jgi:hypothetical protein